ncbi:MAG TPA: hypothetical protein VIP55_09115 [Agromyces sp.]
MADWVASLDIDGWSLGLALLTAIATWVIAATAATGVHRHEPLVVQIIARTPARAVLHLQFWHHPLHGVAVRSSVVDAVADALAARSLDAVVTSDVPTAPLTLADRI